MTQPEELKQECLQAALDGGPDAARYAVAAALFDLADAAAVGLKYLGNGDAATTMGAIENLAVKVEKIATAIDTLAEAVDRLADAHF